MTDPMSTPPTSTPAPPSSGSTRPPSWLIVVIVLIVGAVVVAVVAIVGRGGDGEAEVAAGAPVAAAAPIQLEPISTAVDPFAPAGQVGTDQPVTAVTTATPTSVEGGRVGLYGGTMDASQCNKEQLSTFLTQNPDEGREWARVVGVAPEALPAYIAGLTPVTLRSDTRVTNHGFRGGVANPIQSVLQAGTAVLVDEYGLPVTKCYCGNPLLPPVTPTPTSATTTSAAQQTTTTAATTTTFAEPPTYDGPEWPGWTPTSVTIIYVNVTIIEVFVLVDPTTGETFERPRGTSGESDRPADVSTETTTTLPPAGGGTTTTRPPSAPPATPTTRPAPTTTTTTTMPTTTTTFVEPTPDCVDEFGNFGPCPGSDGFDD